MIKKRQKIRVLAVLLLSFVVLSSISLVLFISIETKEGEPLIVDDNTSSIKVPPQISAGEIQIETPENKTYYGPNAGYYPGTIGFEDDTNGDFRLKSTSGLLNTGMPLRVGVG